MGRSRRPRPARLAEKLHQIRQGLGLTQRQLLEQLNYRHSPIVAGNISDFELGKREPPILLILQYAKIARVSLEVLVDDDLDLPKIEHYSSL